MADNKSNTRARKWQITINNPQEHNINHETIHSLMQEISWKYYCLCDEVGEQGTPHIHLYFVCENAVRFSTIKNLFSSAHIEVAHGSSQENRDYIRKEGKYLNSDKKETKHVSAKTVRSHIVLIKESLKEAVKGKLILSNPSEYVVLPKSKKFEPTFYSKSQLIELFTATKEEPLFPSIYFTAVFGLRRSEVLGLKWDSISFENNSITIKHTVVSATEIIEKDRTKNSASYRTYPMSEEIKQILLRLQEKEKFNRKLFGSEYIDNNYIFKWENGRPYTPDYISKKFQKLLKKHQFVSIRFHDLRHSCASILVADGFTLKDIQEWLGHADIQTTANIYAHLDVERKNRIANSMVDSLHL